MSWRLSSPSRRRRQRWGNCSGNELRTALICIASRQQKPRPDWCSAETLCSGAVARKKFTTAQTRLQAFRQCLALHHSPLQIWNVRSRTWASPSIVMHSELPYNPRDYSDSLALKPWAWQITTPSILALSHYTIPQRICFGNKLSQWEFKQRREAPMSRVFSQFAMERK